MTSHTKHTAAVVLLLCGAFAWAQGQSAQQPHCRATFLCEQTQVEPGQAVTVGLLLEPDEHWHTYWQNPGDAGLATKLRWTLPEGFTAGPIQWPTPQRFEAEGSIVTYGYEGPVLLLTEVQAPAQIETESVTFTAKASWLVCDIDACLPGFGTLSVELPVAGQLAGRDPETAGLFDEARDRLPQTPERSEAVLREDVASLVLWLASVDTAQIQSISFFPSQPALVHDTPLEWGPDCEGLSVVLPLVNPGDPLPERLAGVLVVDDVSYAIDAPIIFSE